MFAELDLRNLLVTAGGPEADCLSALGLTEEVRSQRLVVSDS
jgi:hypothetical protein